MTKSELGRVQGTANDIRVSTFLRHTSFGIPHSSAYVAICFAKA